MWRALIVLAVLTAGSRLTVMGGTVAAVCASTPLQRLLPGR